jgi:1-acyl-sn-glycerol-3-phosphate acyltransferase
MVYPGGGREVCKRKGEAYTLLWKKRAGFVRLAIRYGYKIVPSASVGGDNAFSILYDANDILNSALGKRLFKINALKKLTRDGEAIPPVVRGIGPSLFPRPERLYYSFGEPVDTAPWAGGDKEEATVFEVRGIVEDAMKSQIRELLGFRAKDLPKGLVRRLLTRM